MSQSFLSQVLNHRRNLSEEKALLVAEKLKMRGVQKKIFISLVRISHVQEPQAKQLLQLEVDELLKDAPDFKALPEDLFAIVSGWHHFAIAELTQIDGFKNDIQWIAKKLSLPSSEVKLAIETLKKVGLLTEENGKLIKKEKDYIFANVPSAAGRKHHHESLDLAHEALEKQQMTDREFFTVSFAMDPKQIADAKRRIREFSESLMAEMQETQPKSVYKLSVQFFRLDQETV